MVELGPPNATIHQVDECVAHLVLMQELGITKCNGHAPIGRKTAFGPNAGRKALTLQTVPVRTGQHKGGDLVSKQAGFSLHAGIACKSHQRKQLERLCRYITRPAIAERRLSLTNNGNVVIALKTPYDDGTTHVVLSPIGFMARLAALVPRPRVNLTRFHGVFSPNSKLRKQVAPRKTGSRTRRPETEGILNDVGTTPQACVRD